MSVISQCRTNIYLIVDPVEQPRNRNENGGPESLDVVHQSLDVTLEEPNLAALGEELTHDDPLHHVGER